MPETVPEPCTTMRTDRCTTLQVQPQHDFGPDSIATLTARTGPSDSFHLEITGGNHQSSIDLQVVHDVLRRDYTRRNPDDDR